MGWHHMLAIKKPHLLNGSPLSLNYIHIILLISPFCYEKHLLCCNSWSGMAFFKWSNLFTGFSFWYLRKRVHCWSISVFHPTQWILYTRVVTQRLLYPVVQCPLIRKPRALMHIKHLCSRSTALSNRQIRGRIAEGNIRGNYLWMTYREIAQIISGFKATMQWNYGLV